jgi:hypothetical protein
MRRCQYRVETAHNLEANGMYVIFIYQRATPTNVARKWRFQRGVVNTGLRLPKTSQPATAVGQVSYVNPT